MLWHNNGRRRSRNVFPPYSLHCLGTDRMMFISSPNQFPMLATAVKFAKPCTCLGALRRCWLSKYEVGLLRLRSRMVLPEDCDIIRPQPKALLPSQQPLLPSAGQHGQASSACFPVEEVRSWWSHGKMSGLGSRHSWVLGSGPKCHDLNILGFSSLWAC